MEQPCMRAYSLLLIKTCHRRGIFAMGGMSAQIPVKNDPQANEAALQKARTPCLWTADVPAYRWPAVLVVHEIFWPMSAGRQQEVLVARNRRRPHLVLEGSCV